MLLNLDYQLAAVLPLYFKCLVDRRQILHIIKMHVYDRANDLIYFSWIYHIVTCIRGAYLPSANLPDARSKSSVVIAL